MTAPLVCIVDDDDSVRKGLVRLLKAAGFPTRPFASAYEFLRAPESGTLSCLVLDIKLPRMDGLDLQQALRERGVIAPIVFITGHGDVATSVQAMKAGAIDFIEKPVHEEALLHAVRHAIAKSDALRQARTESADVSRRLEALTPRESEVLTHVVAGRLNKHIAADLGITEKTVKVHRARVMEKMEARSVAELVRLTERLRAESGNRASLLLQPPNKPA